MGTRSGDLDPGVLLYLLRNENLNADQFEDLLNHQSGLFALSGGESDVKALDDRVNKDDARAKFALDAFATAICKTIGAYAALLGGVDLLVYTGGIGEHSARVRGTVCGGLGFLGVALDQSSNRSHAATISAPESKVRVRIVPSEEDRQIARHCRALLRAERA